MSKAAHRSPRFRERGMTLIEMMVVIAIAVVLFAVAIRVVSNVRHSDLREDTFKVTGQMRRARALASSGGVHHRIVFNLDIDTKADPPVFQTFRIEECQMRIMLRRRDEEGQIVEEEVKELSERMQNAEKQIRASGQTSDRLGAVVGAATPEEAFAKAAALEGKQMGSAMCQPLSDPSKTRAGLNVVEEDKFRIRNDLGIKIERIHVQHLKDPAEEGEVSVNFFPLGRSEKAVIDLVDSDGERFSILVYGVTGLIDIESGGIKDPDEHMLRDGLGEEEKER